MTLLLLFNAAAVPSGVPVPGGDFPTSKVKRPEFAHLALESLNNEAVEMNANSAAKWRLAATSVAPASHGRLRRLIALSGGVLYAQGASDWEGFDDPLDAKLDADANYYWMELLSQKVYMGDGLKYMVYSPKTNELTKLLAAGSGEIPEKCAIAAVYRGRLVLARSAEQPTNWYMSAVDQPTNFDFFPPTITSDQAVFGNNAPAGLCPDIVNALIPYSDDYLIFGCDQSIWRMTGDPMEGGAFDRMSDSTGMAFGKSWCKDPEGVIYFFGSKGGVYRMTPGQPPQYLSDSRDGQDVSIQNRLKDLDMSRYRVELSWDFERQELGVTQIPYAENETGIPLSWRWSSKTNAWWEDDLGAAGLMPYSIWSADGDLPGDRRLIYVCQDGYLREVDSDANGDDGTAIDAYVTIGPVASPEDVEVMLNRLKGFLAREQSGCTYEVYVSDDPSTLGQVVAKGNLKPGQNPRLPVRKRGAFLWLRLRNTKLNERYAIESLSGDVTAMGQRRVR